MISENDPYVGIDWDDCRDPETGEIEDLIISNLLASFDSYTEVSPSGTGLKTLIKGRLPGKDHHGDKVGVFSKTRYFSNHAGGISFTSFGIKNP